MLLKISTTHQPATDLGYLLAKHPDRFQTKELSFGKAHVFYTEATKQKCTAALLLDINAVQLTRNRKQNYSSSFSLAQYVNDRPYVASSFLTTAIAKVYGSALNGTCKHNPDLVKQSLPLQAQISVLPARGGAAIIRRFFEPLGYELEIENHPLDEQFPKWGQSPYFTISLSQTIPLQILLMHLYVLIPALDNNKHYYVGKEEIEKLLAKGGEWLKEHPANELIANRYFKNRRSYTREAFTQLLGESNTDEKTEEIETKIEDTLSLHQTRLHAVLEQIKNSGAQKVIDLGCGEGKLLKLLLREKQFEKIVGMDISYRSLEMAKRRLYYDNMAPKMQARLELIQGSLTYRDARIEGFDAAALVEVIEHLDKPRLAAFEKVVFGNAQPTLIVITTPNREYNVLFENFKVGSFRHSDHRFEWTRAEFQRWSKRIATTYQYNVSFLSLGPEHEEFGSISQMAVFKKIESSADF